MAISAQKDGDATAERLAAADSQLNDSNICAEIDFEKTSPQSGKNDRFTNNIHKDEINNRICVTPELCLVTAVKLSPPIDAYLGNRTLFNAAAGIKSRPDAIAAKL